MTIIGCHVQYMPDIWGIGGEGDSGQIFKSITFQVQLSCSHLILNSNVLIGFLNFLLWKQFRQKLPFHGKLCPIFLPNLSAFVVLSAIHKWPMRMRLFSLSLLTCLQLLQRSQFSQLQPSSQSFLAKSMHKKMAKKNLCDADDCGSWFWRNPPIADDPELDAQVPAPVPPGEGQRHPPAPLLHLQDLCLQGITTPSLPILAQIMFY